jgi:hypothetical protein
VEEILAFLGWLLVEVVLLKTGRAVVFLGTAGRWRGEKVEEKEGRIHGLAGALSFKREGQRVITTNGLFVIGLFFYVGLVALLIAA